MPIYGAPAPPTLIMPDKPVSRRRLEGDWLAMDEDGRIALFAGGDAGPIPRAADPELTAEALAAMDAAFEAKRAAMRTSAAYRGASDRPAPPIFDLPRKAGGQALHEDPYEGYPHLIFASQTDAHLCREVLENASITHSEALCREGHLAFFVPVLDPKAHAHLHDIQECAGCRVLDPPDDPRLRAPEVIAEGGLYAFAHPAAVSGDENDADVDSTYYRIASPSVPADPEDLEPIVLKVATLVRLHLRFEQSPDLLTAIRSSGR